MMRCHPAFAGASIPREAPLGPYRLEMLGPDVLDEDYAAVIESAERLEGFLDGDWPRGLTRDDNAIDLAWHLREFEHARSFAWVVREGDGAYLGCLYVFPRFVGQAADVALWVRSARDPEFHEAALTGLATEWLSGPDWPDLAYRLTAPSLRATLAV